MIPPVLPPRRGIRRSPDSAAASKRSLSAMSRIDIAVKGDDVSQVSSRSAEKRLKTRHLRLQRRPEFPQAV
jgi:hypothetical protein